MIELSAISTPHQGTSYSPPADAHQDLMRAAHEVEEEELKDVDKGRDVHERIVRARQLGQVTQEGLPLGMTLHEVGEDEEEESEVPLVKPVPTRKTKHQREKTQGALGEVSLFPTSPGSGWASSCTNAHQIETRGSREIYETETPGFSIRG